MPEITFNIKVEDLARVIAGMPKNDLETLSVLLTNGGNDLLERKTDIVNNRIKTIGIEKVFDDWVPG